MSAPMWSLCQMAAVRASTRTATRAQTPGMVRPPWRSRSSWPFRVWLTDSMICRRGLKNCAPWTVRGGPRTAESDDLPQGFEELCAGAWFLALTGRPQEFDPGCGELGFEVLAEVVLVPDQGRACMQASLLKGGEGGSAGHDVGQHRVCLVAWKLPV